MKKIHLVLSLILVLSFALTISVSARPLGATAPTLGDAESYSVLAGSEVTNAGTSTVWGDVGVSPSIGVAPHVKDNGTLIIMPPGAIHDADAHAGLAQAANTIAFGVLDQTCTVNYGNVLEDLANKNLVPGVYCAGQFSLTGTLTLSGSGVWIFKSASDFVTSGTANVVGGDPCNVWWRVASSTTLGSGTSLIGNILALTSITMANGATLNGRALAQTAEVTLIGNTISAPICAVAPTETETPTTETVTTTVEEEEGTATLLPVVAGLPGTGGAPIRNNNIPWILVGIAGLSTILLVFGVRAYSSSYRRK